MFGRLSRFIGGLLFLEAVLMCVCLYIDFTGGSAAWKGFAVGAAGAAFFGLVFTFIGRVFYGGNSLYQTRRSHTMFSLGWLMSVPFGIVPFAIGVPGINISGAVLEFTSAVTTVGLTFYLRGHEISKGLLLWHTLLAGVGGVGVIVLSCLVMMDDDIDSLSHFAKADFGGEVGIRMISSNKLAKRIVMIYIGMIAACAVMYNVFGMTTWDAFCTAVTTVSTSGFVHYNDVHDVINNDALLIVASVFMCLGSLPLALLATSVVSLSLRWLFASEQVRFFLLLVGVIASLLVYKLALEHSKIQFHTVAMSIFHTLSAITTTGFGGILHFSHLKSVYGTLVLITVLGGCVGSTTGGLKMLRLLISFKSAKKLISAKVSPWKVDVVKINGSPVDDASVRDALLFIFLYATTYVVAILLLLYCREVGLQDASSLALSMVTTSGIAGWEVLSLSNKNGLVIAQWVASVVMMIGRLELISFYTLFFKRTWEPR